MAAIRREEGWGSNDPTNVWLVIKTKCLHQCQYQFESWLRNFFARDTLARPSESIAGPIGF